MQVVWARYMSAFVLALFMFNPIKRPQVMRTSRPWLQLGRSTLLLVSTALNFFALRYLQLDQAIAIIFCTPFIVAALGGPMLGEWIHWRRWTAIIVGFCGVLLVTRPGAGGIHPAALLSVVRRGLLCDLLDLDAHPLAHRQQRDHQLLFQPGRRGPGHHRGAVLLDAAERSESHHADVLDGPVQRDRALPADHGPSARARRACWRRSSIPRSCG